MDKTLQYYNSKAHEFVNSTVNVNFTDTQNQFLKYIPDNVTIFDFGCVLGRDTKYFKDKGTRFGKRGLGT